MEDVKKTKDSSCLAEWGRMRRAIGVGVCLAVTGLMASPASGMLITHNGNIISDDTLQDHDLGTVHGQGGWSVSYVDRGEWGGDTEPNPTPDSHPPGSAYSFVHVVDDASPGPPPEAKGGVEGHTKYIDLINNDSSEARGWAHYSFPDVNSGNLSLEFMLNFTHDSANFEMTVDSRDPAAFVPSERDDVLLRLRLINPESHNPTNADWEFSYNIPGEIDDTPTGLFVNQNEWHRISIDINYDDVHGDAFTLSLDGEQSDPYNTYAPDGSISNLISFNHTRDHMYIGSTVPEPGTLVLLAAGMLMLLRRRRVGKIGTAERRL